MPTPSDDLPERHFRRLLNNPKLVPGIYNYCDRWCERCPATDRCLTYASAVATDDEPRPDESPADFFTSLVASAKPPHPIPPRREFPDPLAQRAWTYALSVPDWVHTHAPALAAAGHAFLAARNRTDALDLQDALDTILWYHAFSPIKLLRALSLRPADEPALEDEDDPDDEDTLDIHRLDSLGSAKVSLLGFDRSLDAWTRITRLVPALRDAVTPFLADLTAIRRALEARVPAARAHIRPGLDDTTLDRPAKKKRRR